EEQGWVQALRSGASEEQILSAFLGSEEFFEHAQSLFHTGNANENFVRTLYQLLLNREASAEEIHEWLNAMPTMSLQGMALSFLLSQEFREETIGAFYNFLLHRQAGPEEAQVWASSGMHMKEMREAFEESLEFAQSS